MQYSSPLPRHHHIGLVVALVGIGQRSRNMSELCRNMCVVFAQTRFQDVIIRTVPEQLLSHSSVFSREHPVLHQVDVRPRPAQLWEASGLPREQAGRALP